VIPDIDFKVTIFFNVEYLENGTRRVALRPAPMLTRDRHQDGQRDNGDGQGENIMPRLQDITINRVMYRQ